MLSGIIHDHSLHARFINMLSLLEHMGTHKIMLTQYGPAIDQPTLKHLAEEARHAYFFKRLAEREAGHSLSNAPSDLIAPFAARRYLQRLEVQIVRALPVDADPRTAYLTTSMIVEFRAIWVYYIYQSILMHMGHSISLKSVLAEEFGHLTDMAKRLQDIGQFDRIRIGGLCRSEQALYERLLLVLKQVTDA